MQQESIIYLFIKITIKQVLLNKYLYVSKCVARRPWISIVYFRIINRVSIMNTFMLYHHLTSEWSCSTFRRRHYFVP